MPYGQRICGSRTDQYESVRSAFASSRYCGIGQDQRRHQHARQQDVEDRLSAAEAYCQGVAAERGDGGRQQGADARVEGGVAHPPPVEAVAVGGEVDDVVGQAVPGRKVNVENSSAPLLGRRDHHPRHRQQAVERAEEQGRRSGRSALRRRPGGPGRRRCRRSRRGRAGVTVKSSPCSPGCRRGIRDAQEAEGQDEAWRWR